jgi:hypothetical protein
VARVTVASPVPEAGVAVIQEGKVETDHAQEVAVWIVAMRLPPMETIWVELIPTLVEHPSLLFLSVTVNHSQRGDLRTIFLSFSIRLMIWRGRSIRTLRV